MKTNDTLNLMGVVCALIALLCGPTTAQYGGGGGKPDDPYLIYTPEQLNALGADPNDWGKHFKLMADIDLSVYQGDAFNPIGSLWGRYGIRAFSGVFDGSGHTISNLTYSSQETWPTGLFAYVCGLRAEVRDLTLRSPKIDTPNAGRAGALIGSLGDGTVANCHIDGGSVFGDFSVGGLIGQSTGYTSGCSSSAEVQGDYRIGGLVGYLERGTIIDCRCDSIVTGRNSVGGLAGCNKADIASCRTGGTISGKDYVGGFVGYNSGGDIASCCSTADAKGTERCAGGFAGYSSGKITSCFSSGAVEGHTSVGGFAGGAGGTVSCCYATGAAQGQAFVGGFAGGSSGHILFSYSTGQVTGEENAAGFAPSGSTYLCCWDIEASGIVQSGRGKGKTSAEMMTASTFAGWGYEGQWVIQEGLGYPRLIWEGTAGELLVDPPRLYGGGAGEPNDPYRINTVEQLATIGYFREDFDKHFLLTSDIDFGGMDTNDYIPVESFTGTFDGDGHAVLNFTYASGDNDRAGLFGGVGYSGSVRNLHLINAVATGRNSVGALAGYNDGDIRSCSATGMVTGLSDIGGLVGHNGGRIEACTAETQVTGESSVGGLAGYNMGHIEVCSTQGHVTGQTSVGGLVGTNDKDIVASCSIADVTGETEVGGLVGTAGRARFWMACPAPPPSFVPGLSDSRITACYSMEQVAGGGQLGGLVGKNAGIIMGCYAACVVQALPSETGPDTTVHGDIGGLVGVNEYGIVHLSYWDTQISGLLDSAGGRGKTTAQMLTPETFKGWGCFGAWAIDPGRDYPRLIWTQPSGRLITDDPVRYGPGSGTVDAPYQIRTPQHLVDMGYYPSDWDKHFVLMSDIDLGGVDPNAIWPIGIITLPFTGTFDGRGLSIANLTCRREFELYVGLFGSIQGPPPKAATDNPPYRPRQTYVTLSGSVSPTAAPATGSGRLSNLHLKDVHVAGRAYVGALAGHNKGTIVACSVTGDIQALKNNAGGLVGSNVGALEGCSTNCTVSAGQVAGSLAGVSGGPVTTCSGAGVVASTNERNSYTGGLIGENGGTVMSSHFAGDVVGRYTAGGLVALNEGTIARCSAAATVTGSYLLGGLVGYNEYGRIIQESFAAGTTTGDYTVGGLVGCNNGTIENCYAVGQVTGDRRVGGLVGQSKRNVRCCYCTGPVSGREIVGGLVGELYRWGETTSCFWDLETSGVEEGVGVADSDPNDVFGLPTASMQTPAVFVAAGWDFVDETANGTGDIWWILEGGDYPRFCWEATADDAPP